MGERESEMMRGPGARWLAMAVAVGLILALLDGLTGAVVLIGLYGVAPLLASLRLGPRRTAVVGAFALLFAVVAGVPDGTLGSLDHLGRLAVVVLDGVLAVWVSSLREAQTRARHRAETSERRQTFLAQAGAMLEVSLDHEETLRAVARLAVPRIADWAFVELLQDDGSIKRVAMAHADPSKEALVRRYAGRYPPDPDAPEGSAKVIRTGRPDLMPDIPDAALVAAARDDEHLRILRELGFRSSMVVPLRARGRTLGDLALVSAESGRRYDEEDLAMAQDLAARCGLAIDNARLYHDVSEKEERLRLLVDGVHDYAIVMLDPLGRVASWNRGAERINGYEEHEIVGQPFARLFPPEDQRDGRPARALETATAEGSYEDEGWQLRSDGSRFFAHVSLTLIRDERGAARGFSSVTHDVTERKELERLLSHQALHDHLTGLPNRTLFLDRVSQALVRADRRGGKPAVLFVDLDRFKLINDSLGHAAGDEVLVAVAERLKEAVRPEDTVSRYGGDEFTVLCQQLAEDRVAIAIAIAERITKSFQRPFSIAGQEVFVNTTVGIAFARGAGTSPDALLRDADTALYEAKRHGRGHYEVFDERMAPHATERLAAESDLRRALDRDELSVVYQPIVDLPTSTVAGVEALVRWRHPERGVLEPADFIPLAEETGLILPIGAFVLETACRQAARWAEQAPDHPTLTLLVNASPIQLAQSNLLELIDATLRETGLDPAALCLEITETALMTHERPAMVSLLALKGLGVGLAIDDFGTGYSSLNYLKRFPVNYLKIDSSFVEGLGRRGDDSTLVAAMTSMAHALGLTVIAEGVERPEQLAELRSLGCQLGQGYLLGRPQPAEALDAMLCHDRRRAVPELTR